MAVWIVFCFFLSPLKNTFGESLIVLFIFGGVVILAIYMMSLFLELEK